MRGQELSLLESAGFFEVYNKMLNKSQISHIEIKKVLEYFTDGDYYFTHDLANKRCYGIHTYLSPTYVCGHPYPEVKSNDKEGIQMKLIRNFHLIYVALLDFVLFL